MTDNEIIKAMQCVIGNGVSCSECEYQKALPFPSCRRMCAKNALDLINRQAAEIERLRNRNKFLEIEYKNQGNLFWARVQTSNLEAIKGFAERLKKHSFVDTLSLDGKETVYVDDIDRLVKEIQENGVEK